ncbi:MAG TPA: hypothetical protein VE843_09145, partial [Ktedonobacteraceae bacterium]|nr:hypothetical protein [Ktedonobacteraceae bacterium]
TQARQVAAPEERSCLDSCARWILGGYVSERDLNQLLVRCIEAPDVRFAVYRAISNNRFKRLDLTSTRGLLGYAPQDDAFEIFQADLPAWLQD